MTPEEYKELYELRAYKAEKEANRLERAFIELEKLYDSGHNPIMSIRSFRAIVEALFALREELK